MPNQPSMSLRVALYLYSSRNIVGSVAALLVLGLFFSGFIANGWWLLTIGAYVFGALATPKSEAFEAKFLNDNQGDMLVEALDDLVSRAGPKLPSDAVRLLASIRSQVYELLPRMKVTDGGLTTLQAIDLTHAVGRDLPETIQNYLSLPTSFAQMHSIRDGKTARQLLVEQLDLLDKQVAEVANAVFGRDAEKLANHGQYLEQKFKPTDFLDQ